MSLELVVAIAPWLGEWVTVKIAEAVLGGVNTQLKQQDLDKALKTCVAKADDEVKLFWRCEPRYIPKFLDSAFKDAVEELQKPFKNQGTPQVDYFVEVFKKSLEEHPKIKQKIDESLIQPWLDIFVKNYFEVTNAYLRFKITKEAYLKQIANYFDDVKFAGIAVEGQEVDKSAQLPQIFVMPDVVEDMRERNLTDGKDFVFLDANLEATGISKRQVELLREQRQIGRLDKITGKNFSAQNLLTESTSQKFVLLGAPGSGKTTLMSYFAVMLAQKQPEILGLAADTDLLPIIIKIRDLAKRAEHLSILDYIRQFVSGNLQVKELPTGFFEYWLDDGRALILLDGLDEVANQAKRYEIVNQIEAFLSQYPENRTIITSRPRGYKSAFFRTEEFPRYTLESFDDDKLEIFIKKWYESRFEDPEESQRRQESLRQALTEQKRIKELARNPLLLTIIALIHRYEAYLPRQRHKLYDRAVKTLLTNWDAGKELNYKLPCEYLHHDDVERLMQQLAYWIHTQGGTGDKEGGTLIDKEELIKQLKEFIAEEKSIKRHQAKAEAERFVAHIQERAGLLNEQGQDCYAFVHKTFQEYLAAQEIKDRQEGDGDEVVLEHIEKYLHNPHWGEVLLLLIAQQHRKKTAKFLKHILEQDTPYEQWLHRNLFFAASCLAEDLEVQDESIMQEILHQLVNLEISDDKRVGSKIRNQVFQTLCSFNETRFEAQALQMLKDSGQDINEERLQEYRVVLGEKEEVTTTLLQRLEYDNSVVRANAALALGQLGNSSEVLVQALVALLDNQDSSLRYRATKALKQIGKSSEVVIRALLPLLKDNNFSVRNLATFVLGKLGNESEVVVQALLTQLQDKNSESLQRTHAAYAFSYLDNNSEAIVQNLLAVGEDEDCAVRSGVACSLGNLGKGSKTVEQVLITMLKDEDSYVRFSAARGLVRLGNVSDSVVQLLLSYLQDKNSVKRWRAAAALSYLSHASETVLQALRVILQDEDSRVRRCAAEALGKLGKNSSDVIPAIAEWISQHQDSEYVGSGIDALWELVATDG